LPLTFEGHTYPHSRIAYVKGRPPAPVVLVHPNYAGLKQFDIDQACFLARAGYVGLAIDLYQDSAVYSYEDRNPDKDRSTKELRDKARKHFTGAFAAVNDLLRKPKYLRGLLSAYLEAANAHPSVANGRAAAIGYCFGGQTCLEQLRAGDELQAIVSFHGVLQSRPSHPPLPGKPPNSGVPYTAEEFASVAVPNRYSTGCKVLIENGDLDALVPQSSIDKWKAEMDENGIDWRFDNHARTPHGFALAPGVWSSEYTEAADRRSTISMLSLFAEVWPDVMQHPVTHNACGTELGQHILTHAQSKL